MEEMMFEFIAPTQKTCFILTCEHASNVIPEAYKNLGLSPNELDRHIARDKGAAEICRILAEKLGCAAFLGKYSRLLIDLNRRVNEDELIVEESDKTLVPGNVHLDEKEKQNRIETYYKPYYGAIDAYIATLRAQGIEPVLFSIHSYTPQLRGGSYRPWHAGVLYHQPTKFAEHLYKSLSGLGKTIGENVPYDLRKYNTGTVVVCGEEKGLDYALIEIRDDEFDDLQTGAKKWAEWLTASLESYKIG